ncbi:hypothetical protein QYE76_039056 [Lolium multiflorum]|uniref:Uncharacterized protein n=1 Tax=Lolium multiflorum TaxID=4521 RepID=A0AAD8TA51_LOLMU|nr:hypothetical protein QYE76_039056 [Lolium multiflorum]
MASPTSSATSSTSSIASNTMDGGKQIETGLVDIFPHPPARVDAYAYLEEPMEMTFGGFHFRVRKEGSHRLATPVLSGLSAVDSDFLGSSSLFETGDEEISPPRFVKPASSEKLADIIGNMSFGSPAYSDLSSDSESIDSFDFIDRSTSVRAVLTDPHDGVTSFRRNNPTTYHQVYNNAFWVEKRRSNISTDDAEMSRHADWQNVQVYNDDVIITTKQGSSLIDDFKETFDNLDKFCLKVNPTKCSFGVPAGELLGFLVSAREIEANPEKIQAIIMMRKPTKLKEIQQLTGRVATLSRFVVRLGEKALLFYALIKQGEKFMRNEEADRAFEDLKRTISTPPVLVAPKDKEPLLLYIAATPQVVNTVLVVEKEEEGKIHGVQHPMTSLIESLKKGPVMTMTLKCDTEFPKALKNIMESMGLKGEAVYKGFPVMDDGQEYWWVQLHLYKDEEDDHEKMEHWMFTNPELHTSFFDSARCVAWAAINELGERLKYRLHNTQKDLKEEKEKTADTSPTYL